MKINSQHKAAPVLAAALIALVLLATLQYYWVGELSRGERERMQANLHTNMQRFSEDFDRELARIYLTFRLDTGTLRNRDWARYQRRYSHWSSSAPYPRLVDGVFLVEVSENGASQLSRFVGGSFQPLPWPAHLLGARQRISAAHQSAGSESPGLDPIIDDVPALLIPLSRSWVLSDNESVMHADLLYNDSDLPTLRRGCWLCDGLSSYGPRYAYTLVTLDKLYMTEQFIPLLSQRHFAGGSALDYRVTVVRNADPQQIIYQSVGGRERSGQRNGDESISFMNLRQEDFNVLLVDSALRVGEPSGTANPPQDAVTISIISNDGNTAASAEEAAARGRWTLVLRHRGGSLDAAVEQLRMRNLLISFSILLLLAISLGMVALSTRRAQRLARQQMDFVTAVSHELRTPLAVICSAGENLADGVVHDPQKARQYGAVIRSEGRRLGEMVEQVLEFASTQSNRRAYTLVPVAVEHAVEGALVPYQSLADELGFVVEVDVPDDLPLVYADQAALRRAIQNLLSNAIKYSGGQRWVGVTAWLHQGRGGPEVALSVQDRGLGIAPADLPHIFEPFYRGREVVAAQIHGSGLGLSLVMHMAEHTGGRLEVKSAPGAGSTFTLYLRCLADEGLAALPEAGRGLRARG